jgi:nicotinamide mononucleotide transporter
MSDLPTIPEALGERMGLTPRLIELIVLIAASLGLALAYARGWTSATKTEIFGFITGGACVWLGARGSIWNWPVGLSNNVALFCLFWSSRLYADATVQIVFFSLGVYGWWTWLRGGEHKAGPPVARTRRAEWIFLVLTGPALTWGLREWLVVAGGAAPFWDALTAVISLGAQFLMSRKRLECWILWIVVDVISVPLYVSRNLLLTGVLFAVFLAMCVVGFKNWRREMLKQKTRPSDARLDASLT